jgi:DNA topoisomerase-6 subunit B
MAKKSVSGQMDFNFTADKAGKKNNAKASKATAAKKQAPKKSAPKAEEPAAPAKKKRIANTRKTANAESMAAKQRDISISEFFAKNRHLLGFDNLRKVLLTAVKEAVDNSLDACEEAEILPDLLIDIKAVTQKKFVLTVRDNGPGIVKHQIPNIFARLLYGSKFHSLKMSKRQQGIGISAAGMYGQLTTGEPVKIISKTGPKKPAHHYHVKIDTAKNKPQIVLDEETEFDLPRGTLVSITLEGKY